MGDMSTGPQAEKLTYAISSFGEQSALGAPGVLVQRGACPLICPPYRKSKICHCGDASNFTYA
jgi:hypothetical protein